jgi:hypothetical protein
MVTERVNSVCFAGFFILLIITVSIAACTTPDSGTNRSFTAPAQPVPAGIVPAPVTAEPDITQVQRAQPSKTDTLTTIPTQHLSGPVSLTVNSAKKQLSLGEKGKVYSGPIAGNVYLVLDITVKNANAPEGYNFSRNSVTVDDPEHGTLATPLKGLRETLLKYLENPFIFPTTVKQGDAISGQCVFDVRDAAEYRVNLVDATKTVIASQPVSFSSLLTTENPVSLTIIDVNKIPDSPMMRTSPGHVYLVLNVTLKNNDIKNGFDFGWESTDLQDMKSSVYTLHSANAAPSTQKNFNNLIPPETKVQYHDSITGQIVFVITDSTEYRMNLIDKKNDTIIASRIIHVG